MPSEVLETLRLVCTTCSGDQVRHSEKRIDIAQNGHYESHRMHQPGLGRIRKDLIHKVSLNWMLKTWWASPDRQEQLRSKKQSTKVPSWEQQVMFYGSYPGLGLTLWQGCDEPIWALSSEEDRVLWRSENSQDQPPLLGLGALCCGPAFWLS